MSVFLFSSVSYLYPLFVIFLYYDMKPDFKVKTEFCTKKLLSFYFSGKQLFIHMFYSAANVLVYSSSAVRSAYTVSLFAFA